MKVEDEGPPPRSNHSRSEASSSAASAPPPSASSASRMSAMEDDSKASINAMSADPDDATSNGDRAAERLYRNQDGGLTGLANIGNTCFLNSALQALVHCPPLVGMLLGFDLRRFRSRAAASAVSTRKLRLVDQFVVLLMKVWSAKYRTCVPKDIVRIAMELNATFQGFGQHDSQEFTRFLLNAMHEALTVRCEYQYDEAAAATAAASSSSGSFSSSSSSSSHSSNPNTNGGGSAAKMEPASEEEKFHHTNTNSSNHAQYNNHNNRHHSDTNDVSNGSGGDVAMLNGRLTHTQAQAQVRTETQQHREEKKRRKRPRVHEFSVISDLFEGTLRSDVKCSSCRKVSTVCDSFMDLSLEIPRETHLSRVKEERGENAMTSVRQSMFSTITNYVGLTSPPLSLETLLHTFCTSSDLNNQNQYRCEGCKDKVDANKVLSITRLPEILCIHIKRFSYHRYGRKVGRQVLFKLSDLDMQPYMHPSVQQTTKSTKYDLFGVVRHSGGLSGGHYVAYAKSHVTGQWFCFNDSYVSPVDPATVAGQQAYMLLYVRKPDPKLKNSLAMHLNQAETKPRHNNNNNNNNDDDDNNESMRTEKQREQAMAAEGEGEGGESEPCAYLVSRYWKRKCHFMSQPGPIDNRSICCRHGMPLPGVGESGLAFCVSKHKWKSLHERYGGGPAVRVGEERKCRTCEVLQMRGAEKNKILSLERRCQQEKADGWYLVAEVWMKAWRKFILSGDQRPGPIRNDVLFDPNTNLLREGLQPAKDYRGLRLPVWRELRRIYGGGPQICRKRISIYDPDYQPDDDAAAANDAGGGAAAAAPDDGDTGSRMSEEVQEMEDEEP